MWYNYNMKFETKKKQKKDGGVEVYKIDKTVEVIPSQILKAIEKNQKVINVHEEKNIKLQELYEKITA